MTQQRPAEEPPAPSPEEPPPELSPQDPVLDAGQEEVFSREEVELGRIEHAADAGRQAVAKKPDNPVPPAG